MDKQRKNDFFTFADDEGNDEQRQRLQSISRNTLLVMDKNGNPMRFDEATGSHLLSTIPEVSEITNATTPDFPLTPQVPRAALKKLLRRTNTATRDFE
ncbi:unnamed protein product, partial [Mesorhabditis belari]|uniref:Uncharacterized protein n=1 Tax=Mesorhabditis belari TaxID=2138241 RepID=A0AAF3FT18_9BILA